jgi:DNA-binding CsgD family transcriptional regulator
MTSEKDFEKLTPMELKVLWHTALLKSIKQIAKELSLSPHTVNNHQAGIRKKLNLIGRNSLVQYAVDNKERLEDL